MGFDLLEGVDERKRSRVSALRRVGGAADGLNGTGDGLNTRHWMQD